MELTDAQWGQLVILATTVAGFAWQAYKENRSRRWASEDRAAATSQIIADAAAQAEATRIKTAALAETLKLEALLETARLRNEVLERGETVRHEVIAAASVARDEARKQAEALGAAIDATKTAAHEAYKEANHVNLKIEDLNKRLMKSQEQATKTEEESRSTGEQTLKVSKDIKVGVDDIQEKVTDK